MTGASENVDRPAQWSSAGADGDDGSVLGTRACVPTFEAQSEFV